ncbi:zf-HC2 domain-containing protein [Actinoplanes sp. NPDC048791]|uniref:zf-HC2 domain-containing protein n=1 Tax=Actinoplanes sp. NPDC048791 TaxID=3154623 RepID=UPI0034020C3D
MTTWHADGELLSAYAGGRLDLARTASVEQHLLECGRCRTGVAVVADRQLLDRVWADTVDILDRPPVSVGERILTVAGLAPQAARLAAKACRALQAWLWACALLAVFALAAPRTEGWLIIWFLVLAPLVPVTGVALAYGPDTDPMHEVVTAAPYPRLRLILLRSLIVLPVTAVLVLVTGLTVPGGPRTSALWLLPGLALSAVTLALEERFGALKVAGALSLAWIVFAVAAKAGTGSVLTAYAPVVQLVCLVAVAVVVGLAAYGRRPRRSS